jgi:O-antigen/teichoic acid export membrane protein
VIVVGLFLAPALAIVGIYRALLQAAHQFVPATGLTELFQPVLFGVLLGGLALGTDLTAEAALVLYIGSMAVTAGLEAVLLRRSLPDALHSSEYRFRRKEWVVTARPLFVAQLALAALQVVDLLVVGAILGAADAALYGVATRVAVLGRVVNSGLESVVSPRISKAHASGNPGQIQAIVDQTIRISAVPSLGFALLVGLAAVPILSLFGSEYADARSVLLILLIGNVTNAVTGPSGFVVSMTGSEWTYAAVMGVHAIGLVILSFWLGWAHGIVGVAIGRSLINVSWNLSLVVIARRRLDVRCYPRRATFSRS